MGWLRNILGGGGDSSNPPAGRPGPSYEEVGQRIDAIEAEMQRVGLWQSEPLPPDRYEFRSAYAADTMSYDQWLQFVFIPRVREIVATQGQWPPSSSVGTQAIREFDTVEQAQPLTHLLCEFDALFR